MTRVVWILMLVSCTRGDVLYHQDYPAMVVIRPGSTTVSLPALRYHFYNMDGVTSPLLHECDGEGNFSGSLPVGIYRAMATNVDVPGVLFSDLDSYEKASVSLLPLEESNTRYTCSRTVNYTLFAQPDMVYSVALGEFVIQGSDTVYHYPLPTLLTKTVRISVDLKGSLQQDVVAVEGLLPGVYSSVNLYSCTPTESGLQASPNQAVRFTSDRQEAYWDASINLFGLCDPAYGAVYRNTLSLSLTTSDSSVLNADIELTDQLTEIIRNNDGAVPVEVSLDIEIEQSGTQLVGRVVPWQSGGSGSGDL